MDLDKDYDVFVRELAMEKKAQPKDRTKTEEEIALEEKEALELAEKKRLRRMMGLQEESDEEGGGKRRRDAGADDLDDDFMLDEDLVGLGAGLQDKQDHDDDEEEEEDSEEEDGSESDEEEPESGDDAQEYGPSDEGEEAEEGDIEELIPARPTKKKGKETSKRKKGELPFTFPCPATHEEFLDILEGIDDSMVGTVLERIRKLHHPSLHVDNKYKLQVRLLLKNSLS